MNPASIDFTCIDFTSAAKALSDAGRLLHTRGLVPATSGNFSLRLADGDLAITASGRDKAKLTSADILCLDPEGRPRHGGRPSAETALHLQLYRRDPRIGAVLHTHSSNAVLASLLSPQGFNLGGLELLKALEGVVTHDTVIPVPVFANDQDIDALAGRVEAHMAAHGQGHAYLIHGHGLYTWASTLADCLRHVEALEHLLGYHVHLQSLPERPQP